MPAKFSALLLGFLVSAAAFASGPDVGGLHHTFTEYQGKAIAHPVDFPQDGKGTTIYLKEVCRALGHDELVSFKIQKSQSFDLDSKQWVAVDDSVRIYQSVTCAVWVK